MKTYAIRTLLAISLGLTGCAGSASLGSGSGEEASEPSINGGASDTPFGTYDCSAVAMLCETTTLGRLMPYDDRPGLEELFVGVYQKCEGSVFPAEFGVGLLVSDDGTWNALELGPDGRCVPMTEGFDGFGTWHVSPPESLQLNMNLPTGAGMFFHPVFTDSGRVRMDNYEHRIEYVRLSPLE